MIWQPGVHLNEIEASFVIVAEPRCICKFVDWTGLETEIGLRWLGAVN